MSESDNSPAPTRLNAVDSFEMFVWLQAPYADVAAAQDFKTLSSFEQWERLHAYIAKIGYLLSKKNVAALDDVSNESRAKLLLWLEEGNRRDRPAASRNTLPSHRLLHSKS